jgi:hypothetical protein
MTEPPADAAEERARRARQGEQLWAAMQQRDAARVDAAAAREECTAARVDAAAAREECTAAMAALALAREELAVEQALAAAARAAAQQAAEAQAFQLDCAQGDVRELAEQLAERDGVISSLCQERAVAARAGAEARAQAAAAEAIPTSSSAAEEQLRSDLRAAVRYGLALRARCAALEHALAQPQPACGGGGLSGRSCSEARSPGVGDASRAARSSSDSPGTTTARPARAPPRPLQPLRSSHPHPPAAAPG